MGIRLDLTNAVIISEADETIAKNGIHPRCPHCGKDLLHNHDTVIISRVGAVVKWECCKCRKQYYRLEVTVPANIAPEKFYERIRKALSLEEG